MKSVLKDRNCLENAYSTTKRGPKNVQTVKYSKKKKKSVDAKKTIEPYTNTDKAFDKEDSNSSVYITPSEFKGQKCEESFLSNSTYNALKSFEIKSAKKDDLDLSVSSQNNEFASLSASVYLSTDHLKVDTEHFIALEEKNVKIESKKTNAILSIKKNKAIRVLKERTLSYLDDACIYAFDVFKYYRSREAHFKVSNYMSALQEDLKPFMRSILVDWLVEVVDHFDICAESLYLTIKMTDLFLSRVPISKEDLQLLGATALFISCKFDERKFPVLQDLVSMCDDAYTTEQFLKMEENLLITLQFDLGIPLSYRFLRRYSRILGMPIAILTLARYILETSLLCYDFVSVPDSLMAVAALRLAMKMSKLSDEWSPLLTSHSGYNCEDTSLLLIKLNNMISQPPNPRIQSIHTKYSLKDFFKVTSIPPLLKEDLPKGLSTKSSEPSSTSKAISSQNPHLIPKSDSSLDPPIN